MISIEKLKNTVKSLNTIIIVMECFHIIGGLLSAFGYYINKINLENGTFERGGLTAEQIEAVRRATTPWVLVNSLIFLVFGIIILILAIKNNRALKNKEDLSYLPYYLGGILIALYIVSLFIVFNIISLIALAVYSALYVGTYLQAKKLNINR
ncbi:hypothetical protein ACVR0O_00325 [Streptococcus caviae]|uniref:hypothetical protein n=1 Tax=Streptococcus sp. 'caviae' TaxID=1915004 RepID=UPI00094BBC7C|nr:hypothetical protein [Streptococcus sp. 'caviae']OLN84809.1 hypothetical protein BMI76_01655 [Streptococcus sp. 'caviae']